MLKAIIFDFDGVLVDSERALFTLLQKQFSKYNYKLEEKYFSSKVGVPTFEFVRKNNFEGISDEIKEEIIKEFYNFLESHPEIKMNPVQHTIEFIRNYKGNLRFVIASMSAPESIIPILENFNIRDKFEFILTRLDVENLKPHPEIYNKAVEKLGVDKKDVIVFEDSRAGMTAAFAAELNVYLIQNNSNGEIDYSDLYNRERIKKIEDFYSVLEPLNS